MEQENKDRVGKEFFTVILKQVLILVVLGSIYLLNINFVEKLYVYIASVALYKVINAVISLVLVISLIIFGRKISSLLGKTNELFGRFIKILIWVLAFVIIFLDDKFTEVLVSYTRILTNALNLHVSTSDIGFYVHLLEIILVSIPISRFCFSLYKNLDKYLEFFFVKIKSIKQNGGKSNNSGETIQKDEK